MKLPLLMIMGCKTLLKLMILTQVFPPCITIAVELGLGTSHLVAQVENSVALFRGSPLQREAKDGNYNEMISPEK